MQKRWQALLPVQCDTAEVFGIDGRANVIRYHGTSPTCAHDGNQHISGSYGVAPKFLVLLDSDEARLSFSGLIGCGVVDSEYANPLVNKFAVKQLAAKRAGPDRALLTTGDTFHNRHFPTLLNRVAEHVEEGGLEEGVELREELAALGPQSVRRV